MRKLFAAGEKNHSGKVYGEVGCLRSVLANIALIMDIL